MTLSLGEGRKNLTLGTAWRARPVSLVTASHNGTCGIGHLVKDYGA